MEIAASKPLLGVFEILWTMEFAPEFLQLEQIVSAKFSFLGKLRYNFGNFLVCFVESAWKWEIVSRRIRYLDILEDREEGRIFAIIAKNGIWLA